MVGTALVGGGDALGRAGCKPLVHHRSSLALGSGQDTVGWRRAGALQPQTSRAHLPAAQSAAHCQSAMHWLQ